MTNKKYIQLRLVFLSFILALAASAAFGAATITIVNNDGPGEGFNDPTPAAPVGGNPGTTIGQQRLNVFTQAANTWGVTLTSNVTIVIRAQFNPLSCSTDSGVIGAAGSTFIFSGFPNAPFTNTWYGSALADKLAGSDRNAGVPDINATFNSNLGQTGCFDGFFFYYGYDGNADNKFDLYVALLHEFAHGLGFQTFTSGSTGTPNQGLFSIYDRFLVDDSTGLSWLQMTDAQRAASAVGTNVLAWDGPQVTANVPSVLGGPVVKINTPAMIAGNFTGGPAVFGPSLTTVGVTAGVVQALDPADGSGPLTTDGCSALTNAAAVSGKIAIIDRGTCAFSVKVKNAQNAGAIGVIIADNVAGSPPPALGGSDATITIPAECVTQVDGNTIKAQLANGLNATLRIDPAIPAGFDSFSKALIYSPNPFEPGSSVSHWDESAFPNQLMEPFINLDLTHNVVVPTDLTFAQLSDIGWVASTLPSTIVKSSGDNQTAPANGTFATPQAVTLTPVASGLPVTWTVNLVSGAGATFLSTGSRVATSTTNASGVAVAPMLTANAIQGAYSMNATVPGAGTATFTLTNGPQATPTPTPFPEFDLQISQADSPHPVTVGSPLTYNLTVSILPSPMGGSAGLDTRFNFPSGVPIVFNSAGGPSGVVATPDANGVSFTGGTIQTSGIPGTATATLTVVVTPQSVGTLTSAGGNVIVDPNNRYGESSETNNTAQTIQTPVIAASATATVSGRVLTSDGRGLRNASVTMTDSQGNLRSATTSSFGTFLFDNVTTGSTYTFRVQSRLFRFGTQSVLINVNQTLPDFVGLE